MGRLKFANADQGEFKAGIATTALACEDHMPKRINQMSKFLYAALAAIPLLVSGCATQGELHPASHVVVRAGVAEFVNQDADTAQAVIEWTDDVMAIMDGNQEILLTALRDRALEMIPWADMRASQQIIALEVIRYVESHVAKRIEAGDLPEDAVVTVREFLETARWAAEFQLGLATQ